MLERGVVSNNTDVGLEIAVVVSEGSIWDTDRLSSSQQTRIVLFRQGCVKEHDVNGRKCLLICMFLIQYKFILLLPGKIYNRERLLNDIFLFGIIISEGRSSSAG